MHRFAFRRVGWVAFALIGCGGGTSAGPSLGGVEGSATVGSLSPAQATQFCQALVSQATTTLCSLTSLASAATGSASTCMKAQQSCLSSPPALFNGVQCSSASTELAGCNVTVGTIASCFDALSSDLGGLDCTSTTADIASAFQNLASLESSGGACQAVVQAASSCKAVTPGM